MIKTLSEKPIFYNDNICFQQFIINNPDLMETIKDNDKPQEYNQVYFFNTSRERKDTYEKLNFFLVLKHDEAEHFFSLNGHFIQGNLPSREFCAANFYPSFALILKHIKNLSHNFEYAIKIKLEEFEEKLQNNLPFQNEATGKQIKI